MEDIITKIYQDLANLNLPYWKRIDFWITILLSTFSLIASIAAFLQARLAKKAAKHFGKSVKINSVISELSELNQRLDNLDEKISYALARTLITEISRKIIRHTTPFEEDPQYLESIKTIRINLNELVNQLQNVSPIGGQFNNMAIQGQIFTAIEGPLANLSNNLAVFTGLLEKEQLERS